MDSIGDSPDISDWVYEREQQELDKKRKEWVDEKIRMSILTKEDRTKLAKILKDISDDDIIFMYNEIKNNMSGGFRSDDFDDICDKRGYRISTNERLIRVARNKPKKKF
jgi:hypothetical protein